MAALDIRVGWRDGAIRAVEIASQRPQPSRLFAGLDGSAVLALLSRLYAVCGRAQRACAELALAAAGSRPLPGERHASLGRSVAREAVQEHLWRLLLDWPAALGLPARRADFKCWYARIAADECLRELRATIERDWLGTPLARLADFADLAAFDRWCATADTPFAALFARIGAEAAGARAAPGATLAAESECALAAWAEHPWVAALGAAGRWLEAHVAARLAGLAALVAADGDDAAIEMDAESPAPGRGIALVATARGMLEHDVTLAAGRVARYAITTPTDRNFAPDGPFAQRLRGRRACSVEATQRTAGLWALAFDPCVTYVVSARESGHA